MDICSNANVLSPINQVCSTLLALHESKETDDLVWMCKQAMGVLTLQPQILYKMNAIETDALCGETLLQPDPSWEVSNSTES